ncbi:DUF305 domain-containing protein [Streptomyces apocyni]|uniref:DUF305 domain-containing protein n=1 Tax=Streptomyces apocyni TaxID=2654677 RepID=UPI0012EA2F8E|nr:DUF305 domain-containing protein [Streptomyces apocyni]
MRPAGWVAAGATVLAAAVGGVAVAVADGPPKPAARAESTESAGPTDGSADAGFARDMAVHHQQAVEMSFVIRDRTDDMEIRRFAYDIANTQANQRGMMLGWLDLWGLSYASTDAPMAWMKQGDDGHGGHGGHAGHQAKEGALMPGMATKAEMAQLAKANGEKAEILFLQLMTVHHEGGVTMAQGCVDQCSVAAQRKLAQGMVDGQESELKLMARLLKERGAKPR